MHHAFPYPHPAAFRSLPSRELLVTLRCDDATGVLTVSAPEDMEGCVYAYNVNGALEGSSQTLNATFTLSTSGMHVIAIEGDSWIGEGRIIL